MKHLALVALVLTANVFSFSESAASDLPNDPETLSLINQVAEKLSNLEKVTLERIENIVLPAQLKKEARQLAVGGSFSSPAQVDAIRTWVQSIDEGKLIQAINFQDDVLQKKTTQILSEIENLFAHSNSRCKNQIASDVSYVSIQHANTLEAGRRIFDVERLHQDIKLRCKVGNARSRAVCIVWAIQDGHQVFIQNGKVSDRETLVRLTHIHRDVKEKLLKTCRVDE